MCPPVFASVMQGCHACSEAAKSLRKNCESARPRGLTRQRQPSGRVRPGLPIEASCALFSIRYDLLSVQAGPGSAIARPKAGRVRAGATWGV